MRDKSKKILLIIGCIIVCLLYVFYGMNSVNVSYLLYRRVPRLIAMIAVSVAITVSTSIFQTVTNNRLLTPDLLGYSQLYVLIQTFIVFVFGGMHLFNVNQYVNFVLVAALMSIFSLVIFTYILKKSNNYVYLLLLIGMILNTLFSSVSTFLQMVIDPNEFAIVQNNVMASFNSINTSVIIIAVVLLIIPMPWVIRNLHNLDVLQLGEDYASNLSVDTGKLYHNSLIVISLLVSLSTALVGPIVFLGMLVVNMAKITSSTYKHKDYIVIGILMSIILVVGGQFIIDKVFNFGVTLSVLLNLIGGLYMIYLILKERT